MDNLEHFIHEFSKVILKLCITIFVVLIFHMLSCRQVVGAFCAVLYMYLFVFPLKISNHFKAANKPLFLDELKQRIADLNYVKGTVSRRNCTRSLSRIINCQI
jgi:hypothetical protein